ncbi:MAG: hypothetical protein R3C03_13610 [Pirellulaceae bacterium]
MNLRSETISEAELSKIPLRHSSRNTVVLKFGGTTLGSSVHDKRINVARKTIANLIEQGKLVVPVFSALRKGRSRSSAKFSVTDYLLNYRKIIACNADPAQGVRMFRQTLEDVHKALIKDLLLEDFENVQQRVDEEIDWVYRTVSATAWHTSEYQAWMIRS